MEVLQLSSRTQAETVIVTVIGELDVATVVDLRAFLAGVITIPFRRCVVLDLAGLEFIDAAGLNALVVFQHKVERQHMMMVLAGTTPRLLKLLEITRLESHFTLV